MIKPKDGKECFYELERIVLNLNLPSKTRKEMLTEITSLFNSYFPDSNFSLKADLNKEGMELYNKDNLCGQFAKALQKDSNINLLCPEGITFLYLGLGGIINKYEPIRF